MRQVLRHKKNSIILGAREQSRNSEAVHCNVLGAIEVSFYGCGT
ncbi:hypothetical protein PPBDW_I22116 [Photobacterium kishitanii]|nr:hypothetical protein PPBDW_I22116 [Photobacterium kishitanii]